MLFWNIKDKAGELFPEYFEDGKSCKMIRASTPTIEGLKQENKEAEALINQLSEMDNHEKQRLATHLAMETPLYQHDIKEIYKTKKIMVFEDNFYELTSEHLKIARDTAKKLIKLQNLLKKDLGDETYNANVRRVNKNGADRYDFI